MITHEANKPVGCEPYTPYTEQKCPCVHAQLQASSFIVLSRYSRDRMCDQTLLPWDVPSLRCSLQGTRLVSSPRRPPAPAQPWACCHSIIPTCLPSFWEHTVSQGSHQPLLKLPSAVASQSLGRREVFIRKPVSRGAPWGMEGIRENKYPLHCGLSNEPSIFMAQQASNKDQQLLVSGAGFQTGTQCSQVP